jgi:hypothetical protein
MKLLDELLLIAFDEGLPQRLEVLLDRGIAEPLLADFKVGPIFSFGPVVRPTRLFVSDCGEADQWERVVRAHWGGGPLGALLALGQPGFRRMFDSDGSSAGELYLDDLQDHPALAEAEAARPPGLDAPVMCMTVFVQTGLRTIITRHSTFPVEHLDASRMTSLQPARDAGGLWGLRWAKGELLSALWVSESRWRGDPERSRAVAEQLGAPAEWTESLRLLEQAGHQGYPDAIEFGLDGSIMVTLGVMPR